MAREELQLAHPGVPRELDRYLVPTEKILFQRRMHWLVLWKPVTALVTGTFLLGYLYPSVPADTPALRQALIGAWVVSFGYFLWETFQWYRDLFVGTDRRLMMTMGVITRKVAMMPLAKVTDMTYARTPGGQIFGYGTFVLESAGQDQALSTIKFVPEPDLLYRRINEVLFSSAGPKVAARPSASGTRLPVQEPSDAWWNRR